MFFIGFIAWVVHLFSKKSLMATLLDMNQVSNESVDAIYSCHNIEHVYPHEVEIVLNEFLRVFMFFSKCTAK